MSSTRRWVRRACLTAAALLAVTAALPAAARSQAETPENYLGYAFAAGAQVVGNTDPPQTLPELLRLDVPHGQSQFGAGALSRARASVAYPGALGEAGTLICLAGFPCERSPGFPPPFLLNATAEYPNQPDSEAQMRGPGITGGDHLTTATGRANAHAGLDHVSTFATGQSFTFLRLTGSGPVTPATSLVHADNVTAKTRQEVKDGVLVSTAESLLSDVSLLGGAIHIEGITARSTSRADGDSVLEADPELVVSGVTVGGEPAKITAQGIEVRGQRLDSGALGAVAGGFEQLLSNGSFTIRTLEAEETAEGQAIGEALGVLVSWRFDASGFPFGTAVVGNLLLGSVHTMAVADQGFSLGDDVHVDPADPSFGDTGVFGDSFGPDGDLPMPGPGDASDFGPADGGDADAGNADDSDRQLASGRQGPVRGALAQPISILGADVADRLTLLYGAAALTALGLALGSRRTPARLRS